MKYTVALVLMGIFSMSIEAKIVENTIEAHFFIKSKTVRLRSGNPVFTENGGSWKFDKIPSKYKGNRITSYGFLDEPKFIHMKVKKAGIVTVIINSKNVSDFKENGWDATDEGTHVFGCARKMFFMKKYFNKGEYDIPCGSGFGTHVVLP